MNLSPEDKAALDDCALATGLTYHSAAVARAIPLSRLQDLGQDYAVAWDEWESAGEQSAWAATAADGLHLQL